ncbi:MAG: class I SAM-dependent methyltransferase [Candidatus Korarchaeota archaeon]|nr:class I SAM-dependent methyltransferase [Candidatus Korarchaeota archaeon]NIU83931.1 methyltransferase domain-containing protein [Candidatus Thorarchaeota archaeon]NIW14059.1 methyltransferase domain-containing protein [Candidatus Thorarchaeota archaeon]NIW52169.1 methyltransferase domain-containing protein [Candidatus Korarchaeota archaeon]
MDARWENAKQEATGIATILKKHDIADGTILDLMCGNGRIAIHLAKQGYNVVGVDISPLYIKEAKKQAEEYEVANATEFVRGDVRNLRDLLQDQQDFDAVVNVWTSIGYFEKDVEMSLFKTLRDFLPEEGCLLIADAKSKEWLVSKQSSFRTKSYEVFDDLLLMVNSMYNPCSSKMKMRWAFYRKEEGTLQHLATLPLNFRVYSIEGIHSLLTEAGWKVLEFYESLENPTAYEPETIPKPIPINLIAKNESIRPESDLPE